MYLCPVNLGFSHLQFRMRPPVVIRMGALLTLKPQSSRSFRLSRPNLVVAKLTQLPKKKKTWFKIFRTTGSYFFLSWSRIKESLIHLERGSGKKKKGLLVPTGSPLITTIQSPLVPGYAIPTEKYIKLSAYVVIIIFITKALASVPSLLTPHSTTPTRALFLFL